MTEAQLVPLEQHNALTARPAPWTDTRVPAQVWHVARAVYGTESHTDEQRLYRTLQAALMTLAAPTNHAEAEVPAALVDRFLTWPVPADVYPDGTPGQPGRTGTNLLSAPQAKAMLQHVLGGLPAQPLTEAKLMGLYVDFDRRADKAWTPAEYLLKFGAFISAATLRA